jgi:hypothetical protein
MDKAVGRFGQEPQLGGAAAQFLVAVLLFQFQAGRFDHSFNRRAQPMQVVLEYVIGRSLGEHLNGFFFADRPRNKNKGDFGRPHPGHLQGGQAVEQGQLEIGKDDLGLEFGQCFAEFIFPIDQAGGEGDFRPVQFMFDQFGINGVVFQDQHPQAIGIRIIYCFFHCC